MGEAPFQILCKFWFEDEVWNGIAVQLPVAVCGESFEEAMRNMQDALDSHVEASLATGLIDDLASKLSRSRRVLPLDEFPQNAALVKMLVAREATGPMQASA